jgi:hypothetical protein
MNMATVEVQRSVLRKLRKDGNIAEALKAFSNFSNTQDLHIQKVKEKKINGETIKGEKIEGEKIEGEKL